MQLSEGIQMPDKPTIRTGIVTKQTMNLQNKQLIDYQYEYQRINQSPNQSCSIGREINWLTN